MEWTMAEEPSINCMADRQLRDVHTQTGLDKGTQVPSCLSTQLPNEVWSVTERRFRVGGQGKHPEYGWEMPQRELGRR